MTNYQRQRITQTLDDGTEIKYTVRSRPKSSREKDAIRWFWFQIDTLDDNTKLICKQSDWHNATLYADALARSTPGLETLLLLDGNIPAVVFEQRVIDVPIIATWNQWRTEPFTDNGKPCIQVVTSPIALAALR